MKNLFWLSLFFIFYTYIGYPCLLFIWARLFSQKVSKSYITPEPLVSIVISAQNEEKYIKKRIENLFNQKYPSDKMEIIIISDGSTDSTNEIVGEFENKDRTVLNTDNNNQRNFLLDRVDDPLLWFVR